MGTTPVIHGMDQVGTTAQRPTSAPNGFVYYDTDLHVLIFYDEDNEKWCDAFGADVSVGVSLIPKAGTPVDGTSGTGAGIVAPGALCYDTTNKLLYQNRNTKASPMWRLVGPQDT